MKAAVRPTAPDFSLLDRKGNTRTLSELKGKVVFVNFWATVCPPCREEMPSMQRLYAKMQKDKFEMLAILENDKPERAEAFAAELGITLPILYDEAKTAWPKYGLTGLPETFIVDKHGVVREKFIGLERIGDYAVNIAERAIELNEEPNLKPYVDIPRMSEIAQGMIRDAIGAFIDEDEKMARDVIARDDEVDELNLAVFEELLAIMTRDPDTVSRAVKITYISKYLERIADHSTNVAEMVVYLVKGKIIRHMDHQEEQ